MDIKKEAAQIHPPNLIAAILAGFDAITDHLALVILPVLLDLFLWLGPRLQVRELLMGTLADLEAVLKSAEGTGNLLFASPEIWQEVSGRINLFAAIRSLPIGIPSLMASELPANSPLNFNVFQTESWITALFLWISFGLLGLILGTLYFQAIAQAALDGNIEIRQILRLWPWSFSQVMLLTLTWVIVLLILSIPVSLMVSLIFSAGSILGQILLFISGGFLMWIFFPLIYSGHGIFAYRMRFIRSVRKSVQLVQMTLPSTALFFLALFVFDQGLGLLWQIPDEASWFLLLGVLGHAFVATGLLAASFIYYRDADHWLQSMMVRLSKSRSA
jgi:hypothetical protein